MMLFEHAEISTIIAALRYWKTYLPVGHLDNYHYLETATDGNTHPFFDEEAIDELIEKFQELRRG